MLRGLDTSTNDGSDEAVVIKMTDRVELAGEPTVYLRESAPEYVRDRQRAVLDVVETLEATDVTGEVPVVGWPKRVRDPSDGRGSTALAAYDEFVEAVGRRSLEPFFEEKQGAGRTDRVVVMPVVCIAFREEGTLKGLYPHWSEGTHHSVENCLDALTAGESVANVES